MKAFMKNALHGLAACESWEPKCWVNVECPTQDDLNYLTEELQVPVAYLNDIEDLDERPRIEIENGWFLILLRVPYKTNDTSLPFTSVPLGLIFKEDVFVSVCFHQTEMIPDFIQYTNKKNILIQNYFELVHRLLLSSSVWYLKCLKQINQKIKEAEIQLERSIKNEELQTLLHIEKSLVIFTTSLKGNDIVIHRIKNLKNHSETFIPELVEDVDIELRQAQDTTSIYSDILTGMMDAYASVISNNLNVIMKQLTSVSIILMIPTLVASLYGMNVPNSLQENRFGFWIVLAFSVMLSSVGVLLFRKKRWF